MSPPEWHKNGKVHPQCQWDFCQPSRRCWGHAAHSRAQVPVLGSGCCCGQGKRQPWLPLIKMCPTYSCTTAPSWTRVWPLTIPSPCLTDSYHQFFPSPSTWSAHTFTTLLHCILLWSNTEKTQWCCTCSTKQSNTEQFSSAHTDCPWVFLPLAQARRNGDSRLLEKRSRWAFGVHIRRDNHLLKQSQKYFRLKSNWGIAHFRLNRGQTLVLQKSRRISAHQVSFMSAELFPSSVWIFSKYMRQSTDQNANEQIFFPIRKPAVFLEHTGAWLLASLWQKKYTDICHQFQSETILFIVKRLCLVGGTFISQQNHRMMEW